ncbi:MAG: hypothetical protein K1Y36_10540 [Blastocatellia bacterium]|nr:hypothetical protein [Blastocatellia bacterium]
MAQDLQFAIRHEGIAQRCEICHQVDAFDLVAQVCRRCQDLVVVDESNAVMTKQDVRFETVLSSCFMWGLFSSVGMCFLICLAVEMTIGSPLSLFVVCGAPVGLLGSAGCGFVLAGLMSFTRLPLAYCRWTGRVVGVLAGTLSIVLGSLAIFLVAGGLRLH